MFPLPLCLRCKWIANVQSSSHLLPGCKLKMCDTNKTLSPLPLGVHSLRLFVTHWRNATLGLKLFAWWNSNKKPRWSVFLSASTWFLWRAPPMSAQKSDTALLSGLTSSAPLLCPIESVHNFQVFSATMTTEKNSFNIMNFKHMSHC